MRELVDFHAWGLLKCDAGRYFHISWPFWYSKASLILFFNVGVLVKVGMKKSPSWEAGKDYT